MTSRANGGLGRKARRHPRLTLALGVGVVLLALVVVRLLRGPEVEGVRVRRGPLVHRVVVSGRVSPPAEVTVAARTVGKVEAVLVDEGQRVVPGQVLVRLDADTLRADVARALATVRQARARLTQLLDVSAPQRAEAVRQAAVEREQAERALERARALAEAGAITRVQLDEARAVLDLARSRQASAEAQAAAIGRGGAEQRLAEAAVSQAEAELGAAEARLAEASLTATVPALVLRRDVEPGDSVQPGKALLQLARAGETRLTVEPDERSLAYLQPGQQALASADAFPRERFAARVETVAPSVDPDRGTVEVKLAVPQPPAYLRPGMTVSVDIEVGRRDSALVLSTGAVRDAATERPWVLVAQDGRAVRRDVELGLRGEGTVEVMKGLSEGDVVLPGTGKPVVVGQRVRVRAPDTEG